MGQPDPATEEKRPHPEARAAVLSPPRAKLASSSGPTTRQAPTPLKVPSATAGSPRPPNVSADARDRGASSPDLGATASGMSSVAIEAALAELTAWRREAERKIARLESELTQLTQARAAAPASPLGAASPVSPPSPFGPLGAVGQASAVSPVSPSPPKVDFAHAPTAPLPQFRGVKESAIAPLAPAFAPMPQAPEPVSPTMPLLPSAPPPPPQPVPQVLSIAPRVQPAVYHYDLEMKPGEYFDFPSDLDGGRRKRMMLTFLVLMIVSGMAALIITAIASQR